MKTWPVLAEILDLPSFVPHRWILGGQLQTIIGKISESTEAMDGTEIIPINLSDGDQTFIEVDGPVSDLSKPAPTLVQFHGLGGSSESGYLLRIAKKAKTSGWRSIRFNHRGAGRLAGHLSRKIYHAGSTDDVLELLDELERRYPASPKILVGFSLSGAILLNLISQLSLAGARQRNILGAMVVCCPLDLEQSSLSLAKLRNRHYDLFFTRMMRARAIELKRFFPEMNYPELPNKLNLRIFDEIFTAPVGGFKNRDDYYSRNSPRGKLSRIEIPTMILQAWDDPVVPSSIYRGISMNDRVGLAVEPAGGHMGFLSHDATGLGDRRWMDLAVMSWCSKLFAGISDQ